MTTEGWMLYLLHQAKFVFLTMIIQILTYMLVLQVTTQVVDVWVA